LTGAGRTDQVPHQKGAQAADGDGILEQAGIELAE